LAALVTVSKPESVLTISRPNVDNFNYQKQTLAFLLGDGIQVDQPVKIAILTATGIGSGVVLTIGNAVLAHALAVKAHQRSVLWWIETIAWVLFLVGAPILVAPTLVAGLNRSALATVLYTPQSAWLWAITAVVIVELLVGAAMTASILANEQEAPQSAPATKPSFLARLGDVFIAKVEQAMSTPPAHPQLPMSSEGQDENSNLAVPVAPAPQWPSESAAVLVDPAGEPPQPINLNAANHTRKRNKEQAMVAMLEVYRQRPHASLTEVGEQIGRSKATVSEYLNELKKLGKVSVNSHGVQAL
jgi:hypothetical protein